MGWLCQTRCVCVCLCICACLHVFSSACKRATHTWANTRMLCVYKCLRVCIHTSLRWLPGTTALKTKQKDKNSVSLHSWGSLESLGWGGGCNSGVLLTILLCKLLGLLIRNVSLGLQVCLVADQNDDLHTTVMVTCSRCIGRTLLFYRIMITICMYLGIGYRIKTYKN